MIDLHCHTAASDGSVPSKDLPLLAQAKGLRAVAITDHDTLAGIPDFLAASRNTPDVLCIPGVELACDTSSNDHSHIVGLFVDCKNKKLNDLCSNIIRWREQRNVQMIQKLNELGYDITLEDAINEKKIPTATLGRPHFAAAILKKGYFKDDPNGPFDKLIGNGKPAYVKRITAHAQESLAAIHDAGGLAIWAHPMSRKNMTNTKMLQILDELMAYGLDGIEAYYPDHSQANIATIIAAAKQRGIFVSGGSDFHGVFHPNIELGTASGNFMVPDAVLPPILQALKSKQMK